MNRLIEISELSQNKKIFTGKISCKEERKSLSFNCNGKAFYRVKIDDDLNKFVPKNSTRCDYAIVSKDMKNIILFIELKGKDIKHAFEQIIASKKQFSKDFSNIYGAIVYGKKIPSGTTEQKYIRKVKQDEIKHGLKIFVRQGSLELKYKEGVIVS